MRRFLEKCFSLFEGTGVGKIPAVTHLWITLNSFIYDGWIVIDGQKFYVKTKVTGIDEAKSLREGVYEQHVTSFFCSIIKKGMTVVDVGASLGYYTLLAAKRVGNNGKVIAFEPEPYSFEILKRNIQVNGWKNVQIFNIAASDREEQLEITSPLTGLAGSSLHKYLHFRKRTFNCKAVPLDVFFTGESPDVVKIDVEGAEVRVLRGMRKVLRDGVQIICEVHPDILSSLGFNVKDVEHILNDFGYKIYIINTDGKLSSASHILNERKHYLFVQERL